MRRAQGTAIGVATALVVILSLPLRAQKPPASPSSPPAAAAVETAASTPGEAKPEPSPEEMLFARKCASCHTIGKGPRVGPDLRNAQERRPRAWLESYVQAPSRMLDTDPTARQLLAEFKGVRMPDLGLTAEQVSGLVDLIARCSTETCDLTGGFRRVIEATPEDVRLGERLFAGTVPLSARGPNCISCHTVRGMGGVAAGGTLAKDLTHAYARLGDEGLGAALEAPPFPVMNKIFDKRPLTPQEAFALRAFLYEANRGEPSAGAHWSMPMAGLLGAALTLVLLNAAWSRRLRGVRRLITASERKGVRP